MGLWNIPFINLTPIADAVEEARRKNRIKLLVVAAAAVVFFLVFRKK